MYRVFWHSSVFYFRIWHSFLYYYWHCIAFISASVCPSVVCVSTINFRGCFCVCIAWLLFSICTFISKYVCQWDRSMISTIWTIKLLYQHVYLFCGTDFFIFCFSFLPSFFFFFNRIASWVWQWCLYALCSCIHVFCTHTLCVCVYFSSLLLKFLTYKIPFFTMAIGNWFALHYIVTLFSASFSTCTINLKIQGHELL